MAEGISNVMPDDWKLVPVEPTYEMVRHAYAAQPGAINAGFAQAYRDMLEAAPHGAQPPEQQAASLLEFVQWVDSWVSHPVGTYSVSALDGLFSVTRAKISALSLPRPVSR